MADKKISELPIISGSQLAAGDLFNIVDISETGSNPSGANKSITYSQISGLFQSPQTAASQAEAEAGIETAIRSFSPFRIKQAIVALETTSTIVTPRIYWVAQQGNDTTGNGSLSSPFLSAQKAYDVGVTAGNPFAIHLGEGEFSITVLGDFSSLCKRISGEGNTHYEDSGSNSLTRLAITTSPPASNNEHGSNAGNISVQFDSLYAEVLATGGNVNADTEETYNAGGGGNILLWGSAYVSVDSRGGEAGTIVSSTIIGGTPGTITLIGLGVEYFYSLEGAGFAAAAPVAPVGGNAVWLNGCHCKTTMDTTNLSLAPITAGRCTLPVGITLSTDKGGNAIY